MITLREIEAAISDEAKMSDSDITALSPKKVLSSVLWEDGELKSGLREVLYKIGLEFYLTLGVDAPIKDITVTGSLANYNYTQHSDVDLHVLLDYSAVDEDFDFVLDYMNAKKSVWNDKHDIKIKGHDVELYAQDINEPHHSTGVYSIMANKWLTKPVPEKARVDLPEVRKKAAALMKQIDDILSEDNPSLKRIDALKDKIRKMRQSGLETSGEYSVENLAFKVLRNTDYIKRLYDRSVEEFDKSLTIETEGTDRQEVLYRNILNRLIEAQSKWKSTK